MNKDNGEIRIGVYVCHCGNNISEVVDVEAVVKYAKTLKGVVVARDYKFMCSDPGQDIVKQDIKNQNLNKIVVSSCSPRMHEETFRRACEQAGVNRYEFQMANIREHCSWVTEDKAPATNKAKALVQAAVARVFFHEPLKTKKVKVNPNTLIVGAGIAGIQAALEIANSGNKVYLVEKEPSIGGNMAKLDKTFPTLDCSACILTPKMVSVGQHENIELLSYSEVEDVSGYVGNFKVKVKKKSRFVNEKCTACAECLKVCPVNLPSEFEEGLSKRHAIYRPFAQSVPNIYVIDKKETPPCKTSCPIKMDVQGYIALIRAGKLKEAYALMRKTNPLPGICGRVCYHPCEKVCKRGALDEPIAILSLKRYIADNVGAYDYTPSQTRMQNNGKSVAIIGSGPGGLTAAYDLTLNGYNVTIFESEQKPGGMLRTGIPSYRLPKDILDKEINDIEKLGVKIKTGIKIGADKKLSELKNEFDAVLIATGAQKSMSLGMEGEDAEGIIHGMDFLKKVNYQEIFPPALSVPALPVGRRQAGERAGELGGKVGIIGGGNTAIDAARAAKRLGKFATANLPQARDVIIFYRRSRNEMPANPEEIKAAMNEGIKVEFLVAPQKIITENGRLKSLALIRMELGEMDSSGRRRPVPIPDSQFEVTLDVLIPAVSQKPDSGFAKEAGIEVTKWDTLSVDDESLSTKIKGVFACADVVTGPSTVTEAMAQGRMAAASINKYLKGVGAYPPVPIRAGNNTPLPEEQSIESIIDYHVSEEELQRFKEVYPLEERSRMPHIEDSQRLASFDEVELGFNDADARREAERCLSCGGCSDCEECEKVCEPNAIDYDMKDEFLEIDVGNIIVATGYQLFDARRAKEYGYKKYDNVITSLEFERLSNAAGPTNGEILLRDVRHGESRTRADVDAASGTRRKPKSVAILHCIGSRDENYNKHCSRICCMYSLKFAHLVREKTDAEVYEFYIDMRAFGKGYEEFYERVQKEKVNIIRGKVPEITDFAESPEEKGKLIIQCEDTLLGLNRRIAVDMVVLSVGIEPRSDAEQIAKLFSLSRGSDGFFIEKHPKLDPMATMSDGIFIAGCCQGPKDIPDTVAQGAGAAARVLSLLCKGEVEIEPITAVINKDLCSGCKICNNICPYSAIEFRAEENVSEVVEELCKGCGTCVAACPAGAIKGSHFTDEQILAEIDGIMAV
jgi:heterodisulfide reductase subunit A2